MGGLNQQHTILINGASDHRALWNCKKITPEWKCFNKDSRPKENKQEYENGGKHFGVKRNISIQGFKSAVVRGWNNVGVIEKKS